MNRGGGLVIRRKQGGLIIALLVGVLAFALFGVIEVRADDATNAHLITVYDRGAKRSFLTTETTLKDALRQADVQLDARDTVEPSVDEELIASEYKVNIYRARPVVVIDGNLRTKIMTPYQTADRIAKDAGVTLYAEDKTALERSADFVGDGAGLHLTITRSIPITLDLYGRKMNVRTQASTVGEMLEDKEITLSARDRVSRELSTPIVSGMHIRVWREGRQTVTVDTPVAFSVEHVYDADRPLGYRAVKTPGEKGVRTTTYEIEIKRGKEVARTEIASIVTKRPVKQVEVLGIKGLGSGLTKAKGAIHFTDSKGVVHRETYYDLNMSVVMQACGQGGRYSVRPIDGVKVDADGYVIIAANYARYPRCSIVETSVGPGKVYDTGGFVAHHPDGFDIATDWSIADGI